MTYNVIMHSKVVLYWPLTSHEPPITYLVVMLIKKLKDLINFEQIAFLYSILED